MWAHYAEKHAGICLGFNIPLARGSDPILRPVLYEPERLTFLLDYGKDLYGIDRDFVEAMIFTKAHEWSYEQEYRVMAELRERDPATGMFYVDFGPELQLREIILGARNPTPVGQVAKLVRGEPESVTMLKARPAFQAFKIVAN